MATLPSRTLATASGHAVHDAKPQMSFKEVEVPVVVQQHQIADDAARRNEGVDGLAYRHALHTEPTEVPGGFDRNVGTAEHDPLRDDGGKYAELLTAAGVAVQHSNEPTMVHGYVSLALVSPAATEATARGIAALRAALHG